MNSMDGETALLDGRGGWGAPQSCAGACAGSSAAARPAHEQLHAQLVRSRTPCSDGQLMRSSWAPEAEADAEAEAKAYPYPYPYS